MAVLAVSIGCPSGIGPEVAVRAAARSRDFRCVLVGAEPIVRAAARLRRVAQRRLVVVADAAAVRRLEAGQIGIWEASQPLSGATPGAPDRAAGAAQLAWIDEACQLVEAGVCDALVTAPVSKQVIASSGGRTAKRFRGHTEHLARRLAVERVVMAFCSEAIATSLVTTHLPLRRVPRAITPAAVSEATVRLVELLEALGQRAPRVMVTGLNPHAGEDGLLGDEENERIKPGIASARRRLSRRSAAVISGPVGAETAYRLAASGEIEGVVAMYHDQATIACKLLGFGDAVNVSLGLPIVRTSVDHGTAYDLAGAGRASDRGMAAALSLASRLASVKHVKS
jgi:4-hydroxythreonine-4-phosphate dehydrogenase